MKVLVFTADDGEESRNALDLGAKLKDEGYTVLYYTTEDSETAGLQDLYDVYSYPSFVVTQDDGAFMERWQGKVPLASDIKMFLMS